jgi:hypothetical protein
MRRVPPSTLIRQEISELLNAGVDRETNIVSALAELGPRYVTQQASSRSRRTISAEVATSAATGKPVAGTTATRMHEFERPKAR